MQYKNKIFVAGFWVLLMFGLSQLVRLGANIYVTRVLEPQMFGVMAVVYVVTIGLEMFSDIGLWAYVVRHKTPEDPHILNVVWTLQVVRGWIMFFSIALLALGLKAGNHFFPDLFYGVYADSRLPVLILIAGLSSVIAGYKSMASPVMSRILQRGKLELTDFISNLSGVLIMIVWVHYSPTIWALVSAGVVASLVGTALSYYLFPYRHQLVWDKKIIDEVFVFGKWIVLASILTYLFMQGDRLILAGKVTATELGVYSIAFMLASALIAVTHAVAAKIVFPVLATTVHNDRENLKNKYYKIRFYLDGAIFLIAGMLISLSPFIINLLYDDRYASAGWMLQILIFSVIGNSLSAVSIECLSALSDTKVNMWVMLVRSIGLFIGLFVAFHYFGMYGAVCVIAFNAWLALPIIYFTLKKHDVFSLWAELKMLPCVLIGFVIGKSLLLIG